MTATEPEDEMTERYEDDGANNSGSEEEDADSAEPPLANDMNPVPWLLAFDESADNAMIIGDDALPVWSTNMKNSGGFAMFYWEPNAVVGIPTGLRWKSEIPFLQAATVRVK